MPWLPMYITQQDSILLLRELSQDQSIAFLVTDGTSRWRAVKSIETIGHSRVGLWHIPSGALPLIPAQSGEPIGQISDPWGGWEEVRAGADQTTPYFGAGHPGIIWLNIRIEAKETNCFCGLSSFEWIGNRYKIIGSVASESTETWWKSLRRRITKISSKVPRGSLSSILPPEVFALPDARLILTNGGIADANP